MDTFYSHYFDYAATTPVHPEVLEAMLPFLGGQFGNAHSQHQAGQDAKKAVEVARTQIATYLNVNPLELIFTSGGTESNNLGIMGVLRALKVQGDRRGIIVSSVEHSAVLEAARYMARYEGIPLVEVNPTRQGVVSAEALEDALKTHPTALVSIMHANNETGALNDIQALSELTHRHQALFHTDAVQSLGKVPLDLTQSLPAVDYLTATAHKIYGPKGVGLFFMRSTAPKPHPVIIGGGQENGFRGGTLNTPAIVGFGKAVELLQTHEDERQAHLKGLTAFLIQGIEALNTSGASAGKIHFNTPLEEESRVCGIVNISVDGVAGEKMVMQLDMHNICVSSGSACHADKITPSHVVLAQCGDEALALSTLRISLGQFSTLDDVKDLLNSLTTRLACWHRETH
jgi:cysteine desulfurase